MIGNMLLKLRRVTAEKSYLVWGVGVFNFQIVAKRMIYVVAIPTQQWQEEKLATQVFSNHLYNKPYP